ncbi:MAG TPA: hypothetical protein VFU45_08080 [Gemmatimonadales bacterium]|nr:hypothetical protein [Gemmatimonadales bacterium]
MTTVTLRPLAMGEILDQAFGLFRRKFGALLTISVVCSGLPALLNVLVRARGGLILAWGLGLTAMVLGVIGGAVATGASTYVVSGAYLNHEVSATQALERALPRLWQLILCSFGFGLLVGLGMLLLFVPGVIALSGCVLCFTAVVVERLDAQAALGRSWELTRGFRWRMLGLLFVFGVVLYVPMLAVGVVVGMMGGLDPAAIRAVQMGGTVTAGFLFVSVVTAVVQIVLSPFLYCILVTAYYDLRVRKEAFDLELLAGSLAPAGA